MTLRDGSFFEKSKLPLRKWLVLLYWWSREYPVLMATEEAEITKHTAIDVFQWLREVCSWRLLNIDDFRVGGPGSVVQIDESLFRHKPKVVYQF